MLQITNFQSPDPAAHFFDQRRLGVELRDLYGHLINNLKGALGRVRSGGDGSSASRRERITPHEAIFASFHGPLQLDEAGEATLSIPLPAMNGTVRLMATTWSERGLGAAERELLVRDPISLSPNLPLFLTPGDQSRLTLSLNHLLSLIHI